MAESGPDTTLDDDDDPRSPRVAHHHRSKSCGSLTLLFQAGRPCSARSFDLSAVVAVTLGRNSGPGDGAPETSAQRLLAIELDDRRMSTVHAHLRASQDGWSVEDAKSKNGTRVNGREIQQVQLEDGDLVEVGRSFLLYRDDAPPNPLTTDLDASLPGFATANLATARQLQLLSRISRSQVPVIVLGESGTGKELMARAVHKMSGRSGSFQAVNCGALTRSLLESELFGHKKGAFSGANEDRPGLIRAADGGTLLLDEIGDLPLDAQAALLRVLQENEVLPVGGIRPVPVDVRVVAATHRDLAEMVRTDRFRQDLLARLSGFSVCIPPLRQRREDLGTLVLALLRRHHPQQADQIEFTPAAIRAFHTYLWPANVRELERVIESAVILADGRPIDVDLLSPELSAHVKNGNPRQSNADPSDEANHRHQLTALLMRYQGNVTSTAEELRTSRIQVHRLCRRFGIDLRDYRPKS
jgi:DNA-binding NtrC family response regulator